MKIIPKTRTSHYWNEDRFIVGDNFCMVIDGATPLIKYEDFNSACWMVNYIKNNISKLKANIVERLKILSKSGYSELPIPNKSQDYIPSASLSFIEYDEEYFYIGILGDCEVTCITKDNQVHRYYSTDLARLDNISIKELQEQAIMRNINVVEARPYIKETLIKHRKMINTKEGYKAFTLSINPIIQPDLYKIKRDYVKEVYLYSDGFAQSFESLHIYNDHNQMFSKSLDINEEINKIKLAAFNDPYCNLHPRLKKIDDITIIKIIND